MAEEFKSAADNLGSHLLGRIPSPPDERDYKLADYLGDDNSNPLDQALANLKRSKTVATATKNWATTITNYLKTLSPQPSPSPSPSPTPSPSPSPAPSTGDKTYDDNEPVLDQGQYGTCVGNGWSQWANTDPIDDKYTEGMGQSAKNGGPYARAVYYEATVIDGQPDDPDAPNGGQQGSTVRSGAKAMQARTRLSAYAFASSIDEIKQFVQQSGPVVVGTDWTNDMFNPDANGYITPTGATEGGHCYLIVGDLESEGAFLFQNSWGSSWGLNGRFKMKYADFEKLLNSGGEACAAVELPLANG